MRELARVDTGEELPSLLARRNDWVPEVRAAAAEALDQRLRPDYARHFLDCVPDVLRLRGCRRDDHSAFVERVRSLLRRAECRSELVAALTAGEALVQRECVRLLLEIDALPPERLAKLVLEPSDPLARAAGVREACARLGDGELGAWLLRLLGDRFVRVRREALDAGASRAIPASEAALEDALLDPHRTLRAVAQYHLRRRGMTREEIAERCRAALRANQPRQWVGALEELGHLGSSDDCDLIRGFLSHDRSRVQRAALRALWRLAPEAHANLVQRRLGDEQPGVAKEASWCLAERPGLLDPEWLIELFGRSQERRTRLIVVSLLGELRKWDSLLHLLRAIDLAAEDERPDVQAPLEQWMACANRSFVPPTPAQRSAIRCLLNALAARGDSELAGRLRFHLPAPPPADARRAQSGP